MTLAICFVDPGGDWGRRALDLLADRGLHVEAVENGADALELSGLQAFDLLLCDADLPDLSVEGLARKSPIPVVVWSRFADPMEVEEILAGSASDYISGHAGPAEVFARLRRCARMKGGSAFADRVAQHRHAAGLFSAGELGALSRSEREIVEVLAAGGGRIIPLADLLEIYGAAVGREASPATLRVVVSKLRQKLRLCKKSVRIEAEYNLGYRLVVA